MKNSHKGQDEYKSNLEFVSKKRERKDNYHRNQSFYFSVNKEKLNKLKLPAQGKVNCNCRNSECLKFYCECFSISLYCDPQFCSCKNCLNNSLNEVNCFSIIIFI